MCQQSAMAKLLSWKRGGMVNGAFTNVSHSVGDKPGWRAARPADAGPLSQGPCCVLHPGESGVNRIAGVTLISAGWRYCIWKRKYIQKYLF